MFVAPKSFNVALRLHLTTSPCVDKGKQFWSHTLWDGGPARWGPCGHSTRTRGEASVFVEKPRWDSPGWRVSVAAQIQSQRQTTIKRRAGLKYIQIHFTRTSTPVFCCLENNLWFDLIKQAVTEGNKHAIAPDNPSPSCPIYELPVSSRLLTLPPTAWLIKPQAIVSAHLC